MGFILRYIFLVFLPFFMRMTPPGETSPPPWMALTCKCTWKDRCRRFQVSDEPVEPMDSKPEKERSKELLGSDMDCIKASLEALKSSLKELVLFCRNEMNEKSDGGQSEWQFASLVLDRFFLLVSTIYLIVVLSVT